MAGKATGNARTRHLGGDGQLADDGLEGVARNGAGTENEGWLAAQIEDRALDAVPARPAVEDDEVREGLAHVLGAGGAEAAETVGRWRDQGSAESAQHLERERMVGHAQRDRVLSSGGLQGNGRAALEHQGEGAWPEALGEVECLGGDVSGIPFHPADRPEVKDERMVGGSALAREDFPDRFRVLGVGGEPIDRFGGKPDALAGGEGGESPGQGVGGQRHRWALGARSAEVGE